MHQSQAEERIVSRAQGHLPGCATPESAELLLKDLFDLLEDYGPAWYTEELHNRAVAVLQKAAGKQLEFRRLRVDAYPASAAFEAE